MVGFCGAFRHVPLPLLAYMSSLSVQVLNSQRYNYKSTSYQQQQQQQTTFIVPSRSIALLRLGCVYVLYNLLVLLPPYGGSVTV